MIDFVEHKVIGYLTLSKGGMPQDVRVSPDGKAAAYVERGAGLELVTQ